MTFKDGQPIYQQIAERLADEVLSGAYPPKRGFRVYANTLHCSK